MQLETHSLNVRKLSVELGKKLKLNYNDLSNLCYAATYHDIGKTKIPTNILYKKERLTEREWELIKTHTILGAEILKERGYNAKIIDAVQYHHERIDGNGYFKIKKKDIPIYSKIICICDAYDAMVSNRIYSVAKPQNQALKEINAKLGIQFDYYIGMKFIELISQNSHMIQ